jgi:gliding motility-associated-like protein
MSTGNPTQWRWDLGNGTISFLQNPSVTYFNPGQYTVKLVVQNANGIDSIIRTNYITVHAQPTVNFSATPLSGCFPLPVQFTDLSSPGSGSITQWEWDFGDGNTSSLQHPSHTYTAGGNYNVSLRITNSNGCFTTVTRLQYVHINDGVNAAFSNTIPSSCNPPVSIIFQNQSTGTGALTYQWSFGDGATSTLTNPSHIYSNPGSYTVQLIVTNSTGCRDTVIMPNAISIGSVTPGFILPDSVCAGDPFAISNTSVPAPVGALWIFGDGSTSTLLNPVKSYDLPGNYQIKLISNFGSCIDSIIHPITVVNNAVSAFTANPVSGCQAPLTVNFSNTTTGAISYQWDFGDGGTSTLSNPSHTYTTSGAYTVRLLSTNTFGCIDTLIREEYINLQLPEATINNLPQEGCAPLAVNFSATINSNEPVTTYLWDFGDGNTSGAANPSHTFTPGVYDIKLTITTASGCTDTVLVVEGVKAGVKPDANFIATPTSVCAEAPVTFSDQTTGVADQWEWEFGDGGTSDIQNPNHIYEDTGYFDVQLIVSNNGCSDTLIQYNYIHVDPPVALFRIDFDCSIPGKRIFVDQSIGADTWDWDFGDGNTSTAQNPVHTYSLPGIYTITLTVTNTQTGCSYSTLHTTQVVIEPTEFNATDTVICRNSEITFNATAASANIVSHQWDFGDGTGSGSGDTVTHLYTASGTYDITLVITDINGCTDTITKLQYIVVNGPVANFEVLSPGTCSMNAVPLSDNSSGDGTHPITSWVWNYGDGIIETLSAGPFQHLYSAPGIYTIGLTITDSEGCIDSLIRPGLVTISQPEADFISADTLSCPEKPVTFMNLSAGPALQYIWDFGDGSTSTDANPIHTYAADGMYTVKLNIIDQYGCMDSITKINYIRLSTPVAGFSVSDTLGTCPPLVVNFTNSSSAFTSLNWDFGDGTSSQSLDPSHFYSTPGSYMATLTVEGPGSCTSVKQQSIVVRGPQGSFTYGGLAGCDTLTVNFVAVTQDRISFIWDFNDGSTLNTSDSVVTHTYTTPGVYVPKMILLDAGGCVVPITGIDTIKVRGITADFAPDQNTICDSGYVSFTNSVNSNDGVLSYQWNFGDGNTSTDANPVHQYSGQGLYNTSLLVTSLNGCIDEVTTPVPVKVVTSPQVLLNQTANGCTPLAVTFTGSLLVMDTSAVSWSWDFGNGNTSDAQNPPVETYNTAGSYPVNLYVTNSSGCVDTASTSIDAFMIPLISAGADTAICQGVGTRLLASGAASFTWTPSSGLSCNDCPNPIALPDSATTYFVTGITAEGCINIDSIFVDVKHPFNINSSMTDTMCVGSRVQLSASGADTYSWSPATGLSSASSATTMAAPGATTTYMVIGTDSKKCFSDTAYIPVIVYPMPVVEAGEDKTINVGQMVDLVPAISSDVVSVNWSPTGSIFRTDYPGITVKPRETTTYIVEVTNEGGCVSRDNLTINVICNGANVFIPNTFSPNGDGSNDIFYPRGTGLFSIKSARVFNRWGEIVYEKNDFFANDTRAGWDGTYKGRKLTPDVYVYIIEVLCDNNTTLPFKGNIALIK